MSISAHLVRSPLANYLKQKVALTFHYLYSLSSQHYKMIIKASLLLSLISVKLSSCLGRINGFVTGWKPIFSLAYQCLFLKFWFVSGKVMHSCFMPPSLWFRSIQTTAKRDADVPNLTDGSSPKQSLELFLYIHKSAISVEGYAQINYLSN